MSQSAKDIKSMATELHRIYTAFRAAGFNEDQAMSVIQAMVGGRIPTEQWEMDQ